MRCCTPAMLHGAPGLFAFEGAVALPRGDITHDAAMVRLKDLFNVTISWEGSTPLFSFAGDSLAEARAAKLTSSSGCRLRIWFPAPFSRRRGQLAGACEPLVKKELGKVIQFERIGFVKIDAVSNDGVKAYFTHK